jgi:Flp pilus assembly protein CpaB
VNGDTVIALAVLIFIAAGVVALTVQQRATHRQTSETVTPPEERREVHAAQRDLEAQIRTLEHRADVIRRRERSG